MYLFGFNLLDAGEFQKNFDRSRPQAIGTETIYKMARENHVVSMIRGEQSEAWNVLRKRYDFKFLDAEVGIPGYEMDIQGMIIAEFENVPNQSVYNGTPFLHRNLTQSPVRFTLYELIPA